MGDINKKELVINYLNDHNDDNFDYWNHLYSFSTENLSGYFSEDLFKNKKVLLTGSSADQLLVAQLYGAERITNYDLNPYVKYLYELKLAAIKSLDCDSYLSFFCLEENFNLDVFSLKTYSLIRKYLVGETLDFWDSLFIKYDSFDIRNELFFVSDELESRDKYLEYLPYLNEDNYNKLKKKTDYVDVEFIETNVLDLRKCLNDNYDLIYFSNIFSRIEIMDFYDKGYIRKLYDFMFDILEHTRDDGIVLLNYLYNCEVSDIYDINNKYLHHIRFPIKAFKCKDDLIYFEVPTICCYGSCKKDTMIGYKKRRVLK